MNQAEFDAYRKRVEALSGLAYHMWVAESYYGHVMPLVARELKDMRADVEAEKQEEIEAWQAKVRA